MLKKDGDKERTGVILTRELSDYLDKRAAAYGMSRSAYIRMLIAQDAERSQGKGKLPQRTNNKEDKNMTKVINANGTEIDYNAAVALMDDDICAELNDKIAPCTEQEFFTAYEQAHADKYGEEWELSKANPCY